MGLGRWGGGVSLTLLLRRVAFLLDLRLDAFEEGGGFLVMGVRSQRALVRTGRERFSWILKGWQPQRWSSRFSAKGGKGEGV